MTIDPIRIICTSDLHFGNLSMDQQEMADSLAETLFPLLADADILFINGDFFDQLVQFNSSGFDPIYETMANILSLCQQYNVALRILQGTWTHDRDQCKKFVTFYQNRKFTFDFKFMPVVDLDEITIRDRTLRIAFAPDDINPPFASSDEVVDCIKNKMLERGWDTIDYACIHGFFDFTFHSMGDTKNRIIYREDQFDFVTKAIDVGHVHQNRVSGKVISNGSFDRGCHGDEDPKGLIRILDYPDHYTAQFIENKSAAVFNTLVFGDTDTTETIAHTITEHINSLETKRTISLRFWVSNSEHKDAIRTWMRETYPLVQVKCVIKDAAGEADKTVLLANTDLFVSVEKRVAPTPKTIASFLRDYIPSEYILSIDEIEDYLLPVKN